MQQIKYKNISDNVEVIVYKILKKEGHSWPGGDKTYLPHLSMGPVGNTNMDINASELIWKFFRDYKLTMPTNVEINRGQKLSSDYTLYQNYPNPFNPATKINIVSQWRPQAKLRNK